MHGTHLPLGAWLLAAWLLVTDKRGISAKHLERTLGVSYETAYQMLHRLRAAMVNPDREKLRGRVEVDETFHGSVKHGRPGKAAITGEGRKLIVLGAIEVRESVTRDGEVVTRPGRLRLRQADDIKADTLWKFVTEVVETGALVATDGLREYASLPSMGYRHRVESSVRGPAKKAVLKHLHLAFSNFKAWQKGTFHGRVEEKHLQAYLNEFVFRFNRRGNLPAAFQTVLGIAPRVEAPTYAEIYAKGSRTPKPPGIPRDAHGTGWGGP